MGGRSYSTLGMNIWSIIIYGELECRDFDSFDKCKFFRLPMKTKIKGSLSNVVTDPGLSLG